MTQGRQEPEGGFVKGMLEYKGITPSFPKGLMNRFGKYVTGVLESTIEGIMCSCLWLGIVAAHFALAARQLILLVGRHLQEKRG